MKFKTAVGNIVQFPVKLTLRDGLVDKVFIFTLTATRKTQEEIEETPELSVKDFLLDVVSDWQGQRLVLQDNNEPAAYSREALDYMLKQPGVLVVVWTAYQKHTAGKEKN
jgi:adenine-specific DNA methylase